MGYQRQIQNTKGILWALPGFANENFGLAQTMPGD
jgi:hypothetical protein